MNVFIDLSQELSMMSLLNHPVSDQQPMNEATHDLYVAFFLCHASCIILPFCIDFR